MEVSHTLATCKDYYDKLGNKTDKTYLLEVSPFVMVEIFCSGVLFSCSTAWQTCDFAATCVACLRGFCRYEFRKADGVSHSRERSGQ